MIIHLIRHTQPDVPSNTCYGQSDIGLLKEPLQTAVKNIKKLVPIAPKDFIYCSPLKRCIQLARELTKSPCRVVADHRLKEMNFGNWELKRWDEIEDEAFSF